MVIRPAAEAPQDDLKTVVETRNREWHFHIYFLLQSPAETAAALALRDAVLRLRRDGKFAPRIETKCQRSLQLSANPTNSLLIGAFVAVPLFRVNEYPMGPHPAGSYESKLRSIDPIRGPFNARFRAVCPVLLHGSRLKVSLL
jgi:DOPA 4,5-dioxygenase